jgi:ubiquinone/menaquinone biosynthesis C-methylase UbiE
MPALAVAASPPAQVLDLGCGYGRIAYELSLSGFTRIRGYDISEKMIERAKVEHPKLQLDVADAAALPESDHSFDAVVVAALLTSVPERLRQRAIAGEVGRVLRPGGTVHGVEFLRQPGLKSGAFKSKAGIEMWHFEPEELRGLFVSFTGWRSWDVNVPSLTGNPSAALQFMAYGAA